MAEALTHMPFGKHKGKPIASIPPEDCQWMLDNLERLRPDLRGALEARVKGGKTRPATRPHDPDAGGAPEATTTMACPACGAMLSVTLQESEVPF